MEDCCHAKEEEKVNNLILILSKIIFKRVLEHLLNEIGPNRGKMQSK